MLKGNYLFPDVLSRQHHLTQVANSIGKVLMDCHRCSSCGNSFLKDAQIDVSEFQNFPKGSSTSRYLMKVSPNKASIDEELKTKKGCTRPDTNF